MARAVKDRLTYKATPVRVSVPATSANLGPGFDCFGLALEMRDQYAAQILDVEGFDVDVTGEGAQDLPRDGKHLVIKAMMYGFNFMGGKPRGIALRAFNVIPHGRGLGSSASAIVGGLSLARGLVLSGHQLMSDDDLVALATDLEGHPDNVAAALFGGATLAWTQMRASVLTGCAVRTAVDSRIKVLVLVPHAYHLSTSKARRLLPETVPHSDATINAGRAALLVHALASRPDLLFTATEDHIHQNYRREAMPKSVDLVNKLRGAGVAAVISGAGPSLLIFHSGNQIEHEEIIRVAGDGFTAHDLEIAHSGVEYPTT